MPPRSKRALLWTSTTYFGEGLPWSFLHQMGTEFLTAIGASKTQIGSTSLLHLAVTFKFAWSPALDLFGKRRTWLWVLQLVLGLGMFAVAAVAPSRNLTAFWLVVSALAVVHATHDIACDGFYLQALDKREQALYSGTRLGAYRLAMIVGSSVLVVLAGKTSWLWGFGAAGVLMIVVALINAAIMPHTPEDRAPDAVAPAARPAPFSQAYTWIGREFWDLSHLSAMIVGSSVLVVLAGKTSWLRGGGAAGVLMIVVALINAAIMPHPPEDPAPDAVAPAARPTLFSQAYTWVRRGPWGFWHLLDFRRQYDPAGSYPYPGKAVLFFDALRSFVAQPQAVLVLSFMLCYRLGDIMMFAMSKPLLRDLGVDTAQRGVLNGFGTAASILGVVLGGAFVARRGLERALVPLIYVQNLGIPLYIGMAVWKPHLAGITAIVLVEQLVGGFGMAGATVFLMQRCRRAFSASHFAMATSVVSLASTFSGYASGPLNERLGHPLFFTVAFLASIPSLVLVLVVPKTSIDVEPAAAG